MESSKASQYIIKELIAQGGFGEVNRVEKEGVSYAMKTLNQRYSLMGEDQKKEID